MGLINLNPRAVIYQVIPSTFFQRSTGDPEFFTGLSKFWDFTFQTIDKRTEF